MGEELIDEPKEPQFRTMRAFGNDYYMVPIPEMEKLLDAERRLAQYEITYAQASSPTTPRAP